MATLEELKAQAEAAALALYQAEKAEREAKRAAEQEAKDAKRRAVRDAHRLQNMIHAEKIVAELRNVGFEDAKCGWKEDQAEWNEYPVIAPDGNIDGWHRDISFRETYSGDYYSSRTKMVVEVGGYPFTKYPMKKDGTFSYAAIAKKYLEHITAKEAKNNQYKKEADRAAKNTAIANRVKSHFKLSEYSGMVGASSYEDGKVVVKISATLTEAEAIHFLQVLKDTGLAKFS